MRHIYILLITTVTLTLVGSSLAKPTFPDVKIVQEYLLDHQNGFGPVVTPNGFGPVVTPNGFGPVVTPNGFGPVATPNGSVSAVYINE